MTSRPAFFDFLQLARAGRRLRPVVIVGEARSGTTLLYRLLQQQPAFGPSPVHLAESNFLRLLVTERDVDRTKNWPLRNYLAGGDAAWARFARGARPLFAVRRAVL